MSHTIASRLHRFERASIAYLVVVYVVTAGLLAAEWVRAVAAMGDGLSTPSESIVLENGGIP